MNYIIDIFDPHLRSVFALIDTETPDHIQTHIACPTLVAVFDTYGSEEGASPKSCLLMAPVDMSAALEAISGSDDLRDWGYEALLKGVENTGRVTGGFAHSFLTEPAYKLLRKREDGMTEWRRSFGKAAVDWDAEPPHLQPRLTNEQRGQIELYEWEHNPPAVGERYGMYTDWPDLFNKASKQDKERLDLRPTHYKGAALATWMGDKLLPIVGLGELTWLYGKNRGYWCSAKDMHGHLWRGFVPLEDGLYCTMRRIK